MFQLFLGLCTFLCLFSQSQACEFQVAKTIIPLDSQTYHIDLCLDAYFQKRDLANKSLGETDSGSAYVFDDSTNMTFDDFLLFNNSDEILGEVGRLQKIRNIYSTYLASLKNQYGACDLKIYDGDKELTISDFIQFNRSQETQPGTRLMLTRDDVKNPSWKLSCKNAQGANVVAKSGLYFFIFIDVYEAVDKTKFKNHLASYLFSYH